MVNTAILLALALMVAAPAAPAGQGRGADVQRRRNQIRIMEGVLTNAVRQGAEQFGRDMQPSNPNTVLLTGTARTRGFVLEGYGVFFDVEIPSLMQSVVWSMRTMERDLTLGSALNSLKQHLESLPNGATRMQLEQSFKRLALQIGPIQSSPSGTPGASRGTVVAADTTAPDVIDDPDARYTDAVRNALIDAMLDYSAPMDLGTDEWVTVAARDGEGPLMPGEIYDAVTIVLRVKGSDLALLASDRTKRDEVRRRVEVRVF